MKNKNLKEHIKSLKKNVFFTDTKWPHFNLLFDDYEKWAQIIKQELNLNNSIIYPMGIVGFITKILFLIKFKTL